MEHQNNSLPASGERCGFPFRQASKSVPLLEARQERPSAPPPQEPQRVRKQDRSANLMTDYFVTGKRTPDEARTPAARLSHAVTLPPSLPTSLPPSTPLPLHPSLSFSTRFLLSLFLLHICFHSQNSSLINLTCTFAIGLVWIITARKLHY